MKTSDLFNTDSLIEDFKPDDDSAESAHSYYIDSGRKLDNLVQKAQRILPGKTIKLKPKPHKCDPDTLPFASEYEHLKTVVGQENLCKNFERFVNNEKLSKR